MCVTLLVTFKNKFVHYIQYIQLYMAGLNPVPVWDFFHLVPHPVDSLGVFPVLRLDAEVPVHLPGLLCRDGHVVAKPVVGLLHHFMWNLKL